MEESTGEGGLRRICVELMQGCASATNLRPAAVLASGVLMFGSENYCSGPLQT